MCESLRMFCIFTSCSVQDKLMEFIDSQNLRNAFLYLAGPSPLYLTPFFVSDSRAQGHRYSNFCTEGMKVSYTDCAQLEARMHVI